MLEDWANLIKASDEDLSQAFVKSKEACFRVKF